MDHLNQTIQNMTLPNSKTSNMLVKYDKVNGICSDCGEERELAYKMETPHGLMEYNKPYCFLCKVRREDKKVAMETRKEYEELKRKKLQVTFDEQSLINPKLKKVSFDNYEAPTKELDRAKRTCIKFVTKFNVDEPFNLLLMGSYGVGKSHLAVSVIKSLMSEGFSGVFISTPKLLTKFRSTYNKDSEVTESQLIELLTGVDCLILDDIGAEKASDWAVERLFEIIDGRSGKHTIYTSNYEPSELKGRVGDRNFSRMMDETIIVPMTGDDYRLKKFQ